MAKKPATRKSVSSTSGDRGKPKKPNTFKECWRKLSDADFAQVESALGFALPASLRAHYATCNGGRPARRVFLDADGDDYEVKSFRRMKYAVAHEPVIHETYEALAKMRGVIPRRLLPFAANSGGDLYCIDVKTETIWFWAADDYKKGNPESAASKIAPSLQAFIDGMVTEREAYD